MKVLLVDNHTLFLEGLQNLLQSYGIEVSGTAVNAIEALRLTGLIKPDVIMINIVKAQDDRLEIIRQIKAKNPSTRVIAFTDSHENLFAARQCGAYSYLLTDIKGDELLKELEMTGLE